MLHILIGALVFITTLWLLRYIALNLSIKTSAVIGLALWIVGIAAVVWLLLTGRLNWLIAALPATAVILWRGFSWLQYFFLARRLWRQNRTSDSNSKEPSIPTNMSKEDALKILGLTGDPDDKTIISAHQRLIQRCHPDRQGSEYLATLINTARATLLT